MTTIEYIVGAILLVIAVALIVCITMQKTRQRGLSASLAGSSAESYYGKNKGMTKQKLLNTITIVLAIVFAVLVLLLYILHPSNSNNGNTTSSEPEQSQTETSVENVSDTVESAVEESEVISADQSAEPVSE
ncbi:MAG: preprotein translocase subunit SecG [Clostridia bacterium]|nr:preprotein translocase subunit SecG [Clostridia bacterium]